MQKIILVIIIALISISIIWWMQAQPFGEPAVSVSQRGGMTIEKEIDAVDIGNFDAEFQSIDADISNL